ncbi:MAG: hypothetical protein D6796_13200 [Caldilineae bacterium]|nr:MAG: hypothetical protein D6796_13200 [Caldilineae bacterium]
MYLVIGQLAAEQGDFLFGCHQFFLQSGVVPPPELPVNQPFHHPAGDEPDNQSGYKIHRITLLSRGTGFFLGLL